MIGFLWVSCVLSTATGMLWSVVDDLLLYTVLLRPILNLFDDLVKVLWILQHQQHDVRHLQCPCMLQGHC